MKRLKSGVLLIGLFLFSALIHSNEVAYKTEVIVEGLDNPWSIAFVSKNHWLVTERTGDLRTVKDGVLQSDPVAGVPEVLFAGQGGLSEVLLHPNFSENRLVYLSFSESDSVETKLNRLTVVRGRLEENSLLEVKTIFNSYPLRKTAAHYGARMKFMADRTLLITSGDGFNYRGKAQALDNHFGKIVRVNDDGSVPANNPFLNTPGALPEIWSYGHRNLQGLVISDDGTVFEHEHGPKGGDELNVVEPGKNYGWPAITYGVDYSGAIISPFTEQPGMEQPIQHWVPSIAPSGMTLYQGGMFPMWEGDLFISALVPGDVRRIELDGEQAIHVTLMFNEFGRIRDVASAPDGSLILATDGANGQPTRVSPVK